MKKSVYLLLIIILLCGCQKKEEEKPKKEKQEVGTMLTCSVDNITYGFYYNTDEEYYYKATYLAKYKYDNEKEALDKLDKIQKEWYENYGDSLVEIDFKVNDNTTFVTITAFHDTDQNLYETFFGDRYNLNIDDINKSFNNDCLIKPIKK